MDQQKRRSFQGAKFAKSLNLFAAAGG